MISTYTDNQTSLLGNWTTNNQITRNGQHYNGTSNSGYWEQNDGWGGSAWSMSMTQTITLPAGEYVLKCAGRAASENVMATMSAADQIVRFPGKGDVGYGIDTSGATNFSANGIYANNNKGRGWEWRLFAFDLNEPTEVKMQVYAQILGGNWVSFSDITLLTTEAGQVRKKRNLRKWKRPAICSPTRSRKTAAVSTRSSTS